MNLSPIVMFVYNRPEHTRKTLESLETNILADKSILYIYADGPKLNSSPHEVNNIRLVREIIREKKWCAEVKVIESDINKGLADSIVNGVTEIVNKYGQVIVLEDDLILSIGFLQYMNDALEFYRNQEKVMHISGYMFPLKKKLPETFFSRQATCWGWATWQRAWQHYNDNAGELRDKIYDADRMDEFDLNGNSSFLYQLESNISGKIKTWAIKWQAVIFIMNGLSLHPGMSLVQNIGNEGSGIHKSNSSAYYIPKLANHIDIRQIELKEYGPIRNLMTQYYKKINQPSLKNRTKKWLKKFL